MLARVLVVALLSACGTRAVVAPPAAPAPPRLVVLLVLDQWPEWAFEAKRTSLRGGGFERLLGEGAWHVGEHPSAATLTGPGHALLSSGEPPARSGIVANEWFHRTLGRRLQAVEEVNGSRSAVWLRVPGLGDSIAQMNTGAKAVAVSLKERSAILSLGHSGLALWYDRKQAAFTGQHAPAWLHALARTHPIGPRMHKAWTPLDPTDLATRGRDDQPGELGEKGFGPTFPHAPDATGDAADAVFAQPLGNTLVLEAARAAIVGEQLGADASPDLLALSLSAHDYIGHGWGQESWEMWDATRRLDRELGAFLAELDAQVGSGRWAMIVTSDHGASPLPELGGRGGGRLTFEAIHAVANRAAEAVLGPGAWIVDAKYPSIYFAPALSEQPATARERAITAVVSAVREMRGIARVERTRDLAGECERRTGDDRRICLAIDPERSGDLIYVPQRYWITQEAHEPLATAHGSIHDYDREVPVLLLAPGRSRHAPLEQPEPSPYPMTRIAPTLAGWLGVSAPSSLRR